MKLKFLDENYFGLRFKIVIFINTLHDENNWIIDNYWIKQAINNSCAVRTHKSLENLNACANTDGASK